MTNNVNKLALNVDKDKTVKDTKGSDKVPEFAKLVVDSEG